jgi:hypothetical protein
MVSLRSTAWKAKGIAASFHFITSGLLIGIIALSLYFLWYPFPYSTLAPGMKILIILGVSDIACGSLLIFVAYNPKKSKRELLIDRSIIIFLQTLACFYGLWVLSQSRPVYVVFEVDRFRVVTASEVDVRELKDAQERFRSLPWLGPSLIGTRVPKDSQELFASVNMSLLGKEPSLRPGWWQDLNENRTDIQKRALSISKLFESHAHKQVLIQEELERVYKKEGLLKEDLVWLPIVSARENNGVLILSRNTQLPVGFLPVDGFI